MSRVKRRTTTSFDALLEEITGAAQLAAQSDKCGARADSVSHWSVRQQLDHLLETDTKILEGLNSGLAGEIPVESGGPKLMGRFILLTGFIPRGRAKAPEFVLPSDRSPEQIAAGFEETRRGFEALRGSLAELECNRATIAHPLLGHFDSVQWLRFAQLHHRHHQKIIGDILRSHHGDHP